MAVLTNLQGEILKLVPLKVCTLGDKIMCLNGAIFTLTGMHVTKDTTIENGGVVYGELNISRTWTREGQPTVRENLNDPNTVVVRIGNEKDKDDEEAYD